jgi:hypothetical protein
VQAFDFMPAERVEHAGGIKTGGDGIS